jgi:hypothetical protein
VDTTIKGLIMKAKKGKSCSGKRHEKMEGKKEQMKEYGKIKKKK